MVLGILSKRFLLLETWCLNNSLPPRIRFLSTFGKTQAVFRDTLSSPGNLWINKGYMAKTVTLNIFKKYIFSVARTKATILK